jgi:hypothetical protein
MIEMTKVAGTIENPGASYEVVQTPGSDQSDRLPWDDRLYEIINGKRVEKPMGFYECGIAFILGYYLEHYARSARLGRVRVEMRHPLFPTV